MDEINDKFLDPVHEMRVLAQQYLKLQDFHFAESFASDEKGILIFQSGLCKLKFIWRGWDKEGGNSINLHYGRLHAPSESPKMIWGNEECYAWHQIEYPLHFLDNRSPLEVAKLGPSHPLIDKYYEEEHRKKFRFRQPEWLLQMHAEAWEVYGTRLFDLLSLQKLDLWEKYKIFLKDVYDIKGRSPIIRPPMDKVC